MAKRASKKAKPKATWINLFCAPETHQQIEQLAEMLRAEMPDGISVSKHQAVVVAVREAIKRRADMAPPDPKGGAG